MKKACFDHANFHGSGLGMMSGSVRRLGKNLSYMGSDWQNKPSLISLDFIRLPKVMNSGTRSGNTCILKAFPENTADYRFKMYANRRYCEADLRLDHP